MYIFNQEKYTTLLEEFKRFTTEQYDEKNGFAWDGPIRPETWQRTSPRILFLGKETYGHGGCDECRVNPSNWNVKPFNKNISKLAYGIFHFYETGREIERFPYFGTIQKELKDAYSKIAIIEVKKTSARGKKWHSNGRDMREHARRNAKFLRGQIELLNPDIIVCCGLVTFHSLVIDMGLFPCEDDKQGVKLVGGKLIVNYYHPSARQFKVGTFTKK